MLYNLPSDLIRKLLIDGGFGSESGSWPIYLTRKPSSPVSLIVLTDTESVLQGRHQVDGSYAEHHGLQVMVRGETVSAAFSKINAIREHFDEVVRNTAVTVSAGYPATIHNISRRSGPLFMGRESPENKFPLYSLNCIVSLTQIEE